MVVLLWVYLLDGFDVSSSRIEITEILGYILKNKSHNKNSSGIMAPYSRAFAVSPDGFASPINTPDDIGYSDDPLWLIAWDWFAVS